MIDASVIGFFSPATLNDSVSALSTPGMSRAIASLDALDAAPLRPLPPRTFWARSSIARAADASGCAPESARTGGRGEARAVRAVKAVAERPCEAWSYLARAVEKR